MVARAQGAETNVHRIVREKKLRTRGSRKEREVTASLPQRAPGSGVSVSSEAFTESIEAAVGHNEQEIVGPGVCSRIRHGFPAAHYVGFFTESADTCCNSLRVQAIFVAELLGSEYAAERHAIGESKCLRKRFLKNFATHGIGTRLENFPKPAIRPAAPGGFDSGANGSWMMGEIIDHKDAAMFAFHVETSAYKRKKQEISAVIRRRFLFPVRPRWQPARSAHCGSQRPSQQKFSKQRSLVSNPEPHDVARKLRFAGDPIIFRRKSVADHRAECFASGFRGGRGRICPCHPKSSPGHCAALD